jgi:hypothetical protein
MLKPATAPPADRIALRFASRAHPEHAEDAVTEVVSGNDDNDVQICEICGAVRSAASGCTCGGDGAQASVPEGWDPELTRGKPKLPLMGRPE